MKLDISIFNNSLSADRDYECHTLNNIRVLLESVLINLCAQNFVHVKTSLRASCVHVRRRPRNLSSPVPGPF